MDWETLAFLLGPVAAPALVLVAFIRARPAGGGAADRLLITVAASEAVVVVTHWVVWWFAFDWVDGEAVPDAWFGVSTAFMVAAAVGCVLLLLVLLDRVTQRPSTPSHAPPAPTARRHQPSRPA